MSATGHSASPARFQFVVVVASLGGLPVLTTLLSGLPGTFPVPVLIISHRPHQEHDTLTGLLQKRASLPVRAGIPGLFTWGPGITVIPGGTSATLTGGCQLVLRPAASRRDVGGDALLASTAEAAQPGHVMGVILSGMLHDGAEGIRSVKRYGGRVLAQDPATARAASMPSSAIATGCVDFVLPPHRLAAALIALAMAPGGASLLAVPDPHWAGLSASRTADARAPHPPDSFVSRTEHPRDVRWPDSGAGPAPGTMDLPAAAKPPVHARQPSGLDRGTR